MSLETDVVDVLEAQCPRVAPGEAELNTPRPFVTWDHIGGDPLRYLDGTAAAQRLVRLQVSVWAETKAEAVTLQLAIENALCAAAAFTCTPIGALQGGFEHDAGLYRSFQEVEILGAR